MPDFLMGLLIGIGLSVVAFVIAVYLDAKGYNK